MKPSVKIPLIVAAAILVVLCIVYAVGAFYFGDHLLPNTKMGTEDVSLQSERQLESEFNGAASNYSLDISGEGFSYKLDSDKISMSIEGGALAKDALKRQNAFAWPIEVFSSHDLSDLLDISYDQAALKKVIDNQVDIYNRDKTPCENATVVYDKDKGSFVVKDEVKGDQLDEEKVLSKVVECIDSLEKECVLSESEIEQPSILSSDERLEGAVEKGNSIASGSIKLVMDGTDDAVATIGKDEIVDWITFSDKDLSVGIDTEAMDSWLSKATEGVNTVGSKRSWTRADGTKCKVSGGSYGWRADIDSLGDTVSSHLKKADFSDVTIKSSKKAATYAGKGKRDWKAYVDIDLSEQKVRYYDDNDKLQHETSCVTGTKGKHDTPQGVYTIDWRQSPRILKGKNEDGSTYESKVTYWLPFIDARGIGLHDATWRSNFGGSIWKTSGSHGCVNLPPKDAKWFYENLPSHAVVVVHK